MIRSGIHVEPARLLPSQVLTGQGPFRLPPRATCEESEDKRVSLPEHVTLHEQNVGVTQGFSSSLDHVGCNAMRCNAM